MFHKKKYFKQLKYIITGDCKTSVVYDQGCFPEAKSIFHDIHKPTNIPVICNMKMNKKIYVLVVVEKKYQSKMYPFCGFTDNWRTLPGW